MTNLATIENPTDADRTAAEALLRRVDELLDVSRGMYENLHRNYVEVGTALLAVRNEKAWLHRDFHSYDSYVRNAEARFGRSRSALYGYVSVAERLLPSVKESDLIGMGITRAQSLAKYVKASNKKPSQDLIEAASDPTIGVDQFKATIAEKLHEKPEAPGKWFDVGGFYVSPEEQEEIERGFKVASETDPAIPNDIPEWLHRKAVIQRLVMEFLASYPENGQE